MKKLFALICSVLSCVQSVKADVETEMVFYSYCSSACEFTYPAEWTECPNSGFVCAGSLCSPWTNNDLGICFHNFRRSVTPAHKAICDAARCQAVQEAMAEYVYCINADLVVSAPCPGCCCGYVMIECEDRAICATILQLAIGLADLAWIDCMNPATAMVDEPSLEEVANAYLA